MKNRTRYVCGSCYTYARCSRTLCLVLCGLNLRLPEGAVVGGEITNLAHVSEALEKLARTHRIRVADIALSESRSYLFEATSAGSERDAWRTSVEERIDEFVPLPPTDVTFDVVSAGVREGSTQLVGIGYARRVIDASLAVMDEAGIGVHAIESEIFAIARALLPFNSQETILIIDIGKTTTKIIIAVAGIPHFATTLDIGGHSLTEAVMKHFGVSEAEARTIKAEKGIVSTSPNDQYVAAMLSTISAIRDEIATRLQYWQGRTSAEHPPITRAILAGGNAVVKGLPEYLATSLGIPVTLGDVFVNLAPHEHQAPAIEYAASLAYATAIGLALRTYAR